TGTIGQPIRAAVTITRVQTLKARFRRKGAAPAVALSMTDEHGHQIVAFGTFNAAPGQHAIIAGTVKEHKTWKGNKQTIIAKAKIKNA
ncbi:hypothetical protein V5F40_22740, partial [Xanthobacter sp. DSM 14520]|uniref:hypothetical protein n=1 Tax=Xanthobacter autotrophicus (strain ATCC BAA-1158 / Py2) TaxID=78245 RepID=UPI003727BFAD